MHRYSIIAVSGDFCSGKKTIGKYFEENHNFKLINIEVKN